MSSLPNLRTDPVNPTGDLVVAHPSGLYCPPGDFFIDPWRPVDRAVITHAHGDHARRGHGAYLAHAHSARVLRTRLGADIDLQTLGYGETVTINGVRVSLYPAGHVLGSAQVRIEYGGQVWVASGDYKLEHDGTCTPFEPVRCDVFITESTFALPIYRWPTQPELFADINAWWSRNAEAGQASVLFAYAFGKAQRLLHGIDAGIGPIVCHGAVEPLNDAYRAEGVALPPTLRVTDAAVTKETLKRALVIAPPSAAGSLWMRRFGDYRDGFASGWMQVRGSRRRRGVDRGFVVSDHADWPGLQTAIAATGAQRIIVTHGSAPVMVRWLNEHGYNGQSFSTEYGDEEGVDAATADASLADQKQDGTDTSDAIVPQHALDDNASTSANGERE